MHLSLIVKPTEAEVFYFHEFLDAVVGTFSTEPRLFDAAKRCNLVRDQAMRILLQNPKASDPTRQRGLVTNSTVEVNLGRAVL